MCASTGSLGKSVFERRTGSESFLSLKGVDVTKCVSLVPRRSLLPCCPREVWERAGEYLSVTSQLTVESRIERAENA